MPRSGNSAWKLVSPFDDLAISPISKNRAGRSLLFLKEQRNREFWRKIEILQLFATDREERRRIDRSMKGNLMIKAGVIREGRDCLRNGKEKFGRFAPLS